MSDVAILLLVVAVAALMLGLPIWVVFRLARLRQLEQRVAGLEAALLRLMRERSEATSAPAPRERPAEAPRPAEAKPAVDFPAPRPNPALEAESPPAQPPIPTAPSRTSGKKIEEIIGERWLGWTGISILLFGAAFFLKYAFENRWIGELGRVSIGLAAGLAFVWFGYQRHRTGWRTFSQIFTAGGVTLMYLSIYAAYGFYDLVPNAVAFAFLTLVVIQAHLLAVFYRAPAIAVMGQVGGFLAPILLSTGRDEHRILFSYILLLDLGAVLVCLMRRWSWIASTSYALSQIMFWAWHDLEYHPEKLWPAVAFQLGLFLLFSAADLAPVRRNRPLTAESWVRAFVVPAVFFAISYYLLEPEHPAWMGAFAVAMAALYAFAARLALRWSQDDRRPALLAIGVSLLFVTIAIPIQLHSNWITLGWAVQSLVLAWLALKLDSVRLRFFALAVAAIALARYVVLDVPWDYRAAFTPVLNLDFFSALALAGCFLGLAWLLRGSERRSVTTAALAGLAVIWLSSTVEVFSYFDAQRRSLSDESYDEFRALDWTAGMLVSVLWATFAALLVAVGLRRSIAAARWSGLALFGLTVVKALFVDIPLLEGVFRIAALVALGLLLLLAGWGYQRIRKTPEEQTQ